VSIDIDTADIDTARIDELPAAFDLALGNLSENERRKRVIDLLMLVGVGQLDPGGVFVARRDRAIVGAFVCVPGTAGAALVWLPRWRANSGSDADADRLIARGMDWLRSRGARVTQVVAGLAEHDLQAPLWRAGFLSVGPLVTLHHDLGDMPPQRPQPSIETQRAEDLGDEALGELIADTYVGSLDFPELNGARSMADVVVGHRATGQHRPADWFVVRGGGETVGVLLLAKLEEFGVWELSYLGIRPRFRRQGWGLRMVAAAVRHVREAMGEQLEVAVDARNLPALQLYDRAGFRRVAQRSVSLHFTGDSATGPGPSEKALPPSIGMS
jgi:ribosomal protein S18 acetylase RimI-like enzyme